MSPPVSQSRLFMGVDFHPHFTMRKGLKRRPLPLALPHPGSNRRGNEWTLSYSQVNGNWGQVSSPGIRYRLRRASVDLK